MSLGFLMDEITITVNDEHRVVPVQFTVEKLQHTLKAPNSGVAIAINGAVVPKEFWSNTELKNNDSVLIITATQGG